MKVLELFAGTRSIGKAFEARGHEVFSVDWDKSFENISLCADIMTLTAKEVLLKFGRPDVIWASFDCATFSIAAISHHRRKNLETGNLDPVSDYAKFCDAVDQHVLRLIMALSPKYWFIENPRGGMRKMVWMEGLPRYTVTYCQYELDKPVSERRMKPTDIWTNHPDPKFKPMCKNGDPCHAAAPRGAKTGTQGLKGSKERSVIPEALCRHIVDICEKQTRNDYLDIVSCLANYIRHYDDAPAAAALLANGVIVPKFKIGDKVYIPDDFGRTDAVIENIVITNRGLCYEWVTYDVGVDETEVWDCGSFKDADIGKTVFLSFEDYEKALAERSKE